MGWSILVVEDDADAREMLMEGLATEGGLAVCAAGNIGAAQMLMARRAEDFSLMVLDVGLPDGDGRDFCASLRRQGFDLPVILLTDLAREDDVVRGFEAGADDCLVKPFSCSELLARIGAQLRYVGRKSDIADASRKAVQNVRE